MSICLTMFIFAILEHNIVQHICKTIEILIQWSLTAGYSQYACSKCAKTWFNFDKIWSIVHMGVKIGDGVSYVKKKMGRAGKKVRMHFRNNCNFIASFITFLPYSI